MQLGQVIGHATMTVRHATLRGWRLLLVQPFDNRRRPDGDPVLAIDRLGGSPGDEVILSSDGASVREMVGSKQTPLRWAVIGLADRRSAESGA
jgi:ethanolamine utilization protein EutN